MKNKALIFECVGGVAVQVILPPRNPGNECRNQALNLRANH
jgi:hypothetical protein